MTLYYRYKPFLRNQVCLRSKISPPLPIKRPQRAAVFFIIMDGPDWADVPVRGEPPAMKCLMSGEPLISTKSGLSEGLPRRQSIGALLTKAAARSAGSAKSGVFYSVVEMLVSPRPALSNKDEYWKSAHRDLLESMVS
jgi:hypothetical protein